MVFLCSGQADTINGATMYTDGGMLPGALYEVFENGAPVALVGDGSLSVADPRA